MNRAVPNRTAAALTATGARRGAMREAVRRDVWARWASMLVSCSIECLLEMSYQLEFLSLALDLWFYYE